MKSAKINLKTAENVKDFVHITEQFDHDIDIRSGRFVVNAKSILGIFSLDLSKPLVIEIYAEDCDEILAKLKPFIVD